MANTSERYYQLTHYLTQLRAQELEIALLGYPEYLENKLQWIEEEIDRTLDGLRSIEF